MGSTPRSGRGAHPRGRFARKSLRHLLVLRYGIFSSTCISQYGIFPLWIAFTYAAMRQWLALSADVRRRLDAKLATFAQTGRGDVKCLKGRDGMRLRAGDWRVIFYVEDNSIIVV